MIKIETRELSDLSEAERDALDEQYIDVTWPILERFKKELETSMPSSALDSAIDSVKGVSEEDLSYIKPVFANPAIAGPFNAMLDIALSHRRETYKDENPPKQVEDVLDYAVRARILAKNAKLSLGDFLGDIVANEDFMTREQVFDEASDILMDACFKKVNAAKVNDYIKDAGRALTAYGLNNLKDYSKFDEFKKEAVQFAHAKAIHRSAPEPA